MSSQQIDLSLFIPFLKSLPALRAPASTVCQ
jgi:hypothetical protein